MKKLILTLCSIFIATVALADGEITAPREYNLDNPPRFYDTGTVIEWAPTTSVTFFGDSDIVFGPEEFESMTEQEMRNFVLLVEICSHVEIHSPLIQIWGKKLLPRFFNKEADGYTIDAGNWTLTLDSSIIIADIDLLELLKRCREFIDDYSERIYSTTITLEPAVYMLPPTWYDYLEKQNKDEIKEAQENMEMRKRERKLRQDIETIIKHLEEVK